MSRREAILLGAAVCLAAGVEAADAGRRQKPVALPAIAATTLVAVPLDADVHAATADGYGDLRIFDAAGGEVPHVVRDVTATTSECRRVPRTLAGGEEREVRETTRVDRRSFRIDSIEFSSTEEVERTASVRAADQTIVATPPPAAEPFRLLADGRFQVAVIAVLAAILAAALFRAARRLDAQSPPQD